MNRKRTIIIIILLAGILAFIGYQKREVVLPFISRIIKSQPDLSKKEADYSLSANELFSAYEKNEEEADEKYKDKILLVNGEITEINERSVVLGNGMGGVSCAIKEEALEQLDNLKEGDIIKTKGICVGMGLFDVNLTKCVVVE